MRRGRCSFVGRSVGRPSCERAAHTHPAPIRAVSRQHRRDAALIYFDAMNDVGGREAPGLCREAGGRDGAPELAGRREFHGARLYPRTIKISAAHSSFSMACSTCRTVGSTGIASRPRTRIRLGGRFPGGRSAAPHGLAYGGAERRASGVPDHFLPTGHRSFRSQGIPRRATPGLASCDARRERHQHELPRRSQEQPGAERRLLALVAAWPELHTDHFPRHEPRAALDIPTRRHG
jgi:hypothetical protein